MSGPEEQKLITHHGRQFLDFLNPVSYDREGIARIIGLVEQQARWHGVGPVREALEAEWYNGNLAESVYDRLLKVSGVDTNAGSDHDGHGHAAEDCPDR